MPETKQEQWHLSKSVPLTLVFAIIAQTIALVWFISNLNSSVETNAREIVRNETRITTLETLVRDQSIAIARMDENIKAIREAVEHMANQSASQK
jgi:CII-binding regulator of phage lambda lysogenization HflD